MFSFVQEARDQTQPGSLFSRSWGRGERDPGNEVGSETAPNDTTDKLYLQVRKRSVAAGL